MKIAVTRQIPSIGLELLKEKHDVIQWPSLKPPSPADLLQLLRGADAAMTMLSDRINGEFMDQCPNLKMIANMAVGFENIDIEAAAQRGLLVTNTPDVLTDATAEVAILLMLSVMRRAIESDRHMRAGNYKFWDPLTLLGNQMNGKMLGIVGFGRIGQATARRAAAFGMGIQFSAPTVVNWGDPTLPAKQVDFDALIATSDVVSLHCPYKTELHHMINSEVLGKMKNSAYFINTARGGLMDEQAVYQALVDGTIAGAGLDVYENEPAFVGELAELDNVVMLPHIGSATEETRDAMAKLAAENIIAVLAGNKPITPVNIF